MELMFFALMHALYILIFMRYRDSRALNAWTAALLA